MTEGQDHIAATEAATVPPVSAIPPDEIARLTDDITAALKTVYDPEIPVDIYELGLIYKVDIEDDRLVLRQFYDALPTNPAAHSFGFETWPRRHSNRCRGPKMRRSRSGLLIRNPLDLSLRASSRPSACPMGQR